MMAMAIPDDLQSSECEAGTLTADFYLVFISQVSAQKWGRPDG